MVTVDANNDDDCNDDQDDDDDNDRDGDGRRVSSSRTFIDSMKVHQPKMEWTSVSSSIITSSVVVEVGSSYTTLWVVFTLRYVKKC